MSAVFATTLGPSVYWYLTRGTGAVSLVLLTASVVIGVAGSLGTSAAGWPRFAVDTVHRDLSLLAIAFLVVHILTSVLDSFAPISLTAAVIPFVSSYRPLWLGLGALAFDLLVAVAITSLVRRRLGYRAWRAVHWLAYASWPIAVLHGLGTGTDSKVWWMLALTAACVAAVAIAVCLRVAQGADVAPGMRTPAVALSLATPMVLLEFTAWGPLQKGWARRAGTPSRLLASAHRARPVAVTHVSAKYTPRRFSATLTGSAREEQVANGAIVDLEMRLGGGARGKLRVRLGGEPIQGGGLSMTGSQVDLIADGIPFVMQGRISFLEGERLTAHLRGGSGAALTLHMRLSLDSQTSAVTGTMTALPGVQP